jgi:hypothetical protein
MASLGWAAGQGFWPRRRRRVCLPERLSEISDAARFAIHI